MECEYILVRTTYSKGDLARVGYGIALAQECDGNAMILESFPDLSPDSDKVEALVRICNELALEPIHLGDVVQDFLFEA